LISPEKKIVWQAKGAFKWNDAKARDQLMKLMEDESEAVQDNSKTGQDQESEPAPEE
jgi:hypothetical protein